MKKRLLFILLIAATSVHAQLNPAMIQFELQPLDLNPALAGMHDGDLRLGAGYQFSFFYFNSPSLNDTAQRFLFPSHSSYLAGDLAFGRITTAKGREHRFGAGLIVDYSHESQYNHSNYTNVALKTAFHLSLDKNNSSYLSFGAGAEYGSVFAPERVSVNNYGMGLDTTVIEALNMNGWEASAGVQWQIKKKWGQIALSAALNQFLTNIHEPYYSRTPLQANLVLNSQFNLNNRARIYPLMQYVQRRNEWGYRIGRSDFFRVQLQGGYLVGDPMNKQELLIGFGTSRNDGESYNSFDFLDKLTFRLGYKNADLNIGLAYQWFNIHPDWGQTHSFELQANYLLRWSK